MNSDAEGLFGNLNDGANIATILPDVHINAILQGSGSGVELSSRAILSNQQCVDVSCTIISMPHASRERVIIAVRSDLQPTLRIIDGGAQKDNELHEIESIPALPLPTSAIDSIDSKVLNSPPLLGSVLSSIDDVVWAIAPETFEMIYVSPAAVKLLGCTYAELTENPRRWLDAIYPDDSAEVAERLQALFDYGQVEFECRFVCSDGQIHWMTTKAKAIWNDRGELVRAEGVSSDITGRKLKELELQNINDKLHKRVERIATLHQIGCAISSNQELNKTLSVCLDQLVKQLHIDAARILVSDPYTQRMRFAVGSGFRFGGGASLQRMLGASQASRVALGRCTVYIADLASQPDAFPPSTVLDMQGFVSYLGVPLITNGQVQGILEIFQRSHLNPTHEWTSFAEALAAQAGAAIYSASMVERLQRVNNDLCVAYDRTIEGWSHALDLRDKETEGHSQRVTEMSLRMAKAMGMNELKLVQVRRGALLHDIGKMGVPDQILLKPGPLTDEEWKIMRMHPVYAYEMLSPIEFLRPAIDIPYCHHEKWDGSGYPRKLKGVQIPISARIFAVVDVWDALRSDRPYRQRWSVDKVVNHVKSLSGSHFDPQVLDAFINELRKGSFDDLITGNEYPSGATMDSTEEDQEEKDSAA
jgi:PAS domain S-box-containing protein/putative nucleotidyltransferase with HDIG domain